MLFMSHTLSAAAAFGRFRKLFDHHEVEQYLAVATSAVRSREPLSATTTRRTSPSGIASSTSPIESRSFSAGMTTSTTVTSDTRS